MEAIVEQHHVHDTGLARLVEERIEAADAIDAMSEVGSAEEHSEDERSSVTDKDDGETFKLTEVDATNPSDGRKNSLIDTDRPYTQQTKIDAKKKDVNYKRLPTPDVDLPLVPLLLMPEPSPVGTFSCRMHNA